MSEVKEADPVAKAKLIEAEKMRVAYEHALDDEMEYILNPKKQESYYNKTLNKYAQPTCYRVAGILCVLGMGIIAPLYGWWIMEAMNNMNEQFVLKSLGLEYDVMGKVLPWCGIMLAGATVIFVTKAFSGVFLNYVAENLTTGIRKDLYTAFMRKHIGWHDDRENASGVLTATLSSDV